MDALREANLNANFLLFVFVFQSNVPHRAALPGEQDLD